MKSILFLGGICLSILAPSQVSWYDEFSDSTLQRNPTWYGDTTKFIHQNEQLQLRDTDAGSSEVYTHSLVSQQGNWSGWINLDFNPSSSNFAEIDLCRDTNGRAHFLRFGGDSRDCIALYSRIGTIETELIKSQDGILSSTPTVQWSVDRNLDSTWTLSLNIDSTSWQSVGSIFDSSFYPSSHFAVRCTYTKTRADKFYFDDISVSGFPFLDTVAPSVTSYRWSSRTKLHVQLSEPTFSDSSTIRDQHGHPWHLNYINPTQLMLISDVPATNGSYTFDFSVITDAYQNPLSNYTFTLNRPVPRSIIISEIMPDNQPVVSWPAEYIELWNPTSDSISLTDWQLHINGSTHELGELWIHADERILVTSDLLNIPNAQVEVNTSSLLPNESGMIWVVDDWGEQIDGVAYSSALFTIGWKSHGGWSLERDESYPSCALNQAWRESTDLSGGTPGQPNKPAIQTSSPLNHLTSIDYQEDTVVLNFSIALDSLYCPLAVCTPIDIRKNSWTLTELQSSTLPISASTCLGLSLDTTVIQLPESISKSSQILITEVLYDPEDGIAEFVEIANIGDKAVLLDELRISSWSFGFGIEELHPITTIAQPLLPNEVLVLGRGDADALFRRYPTQNKRAWCMDALPVSLSKEDGLCIAMPNGTLLDSVMWNDDLHNEFLSDTKGISLERNLSDYSLSSSSDPNGATPGIWMYEHGQWTSDIKLENARFSPNGDRYKDEVIMHLPARWEDWVVQFTVSNASAIQVDGSRHESRVTRLGKIKWDGRANGNVLPHGQYLLSIRAISPTGKVETWRHGCLLIHE